MKHALRFYPVMLVSILFFTIQSGCNVPTEESNTASLEVHLQSSFDGEHVRVKIDRRTVFNDRVQTNHLIGLAKIIPLEEREGSHRIQIEVDDNFMAEQHFKLKDRLFIGVAFYRTSIPEAGLDAGIQFRLSETFFGYD